MRPDCSGRLACPKGPSPSTGRLQNAHYLTIPPTPPGAKIVSPPHRSSFAVQSNHKIPNGVPDLIQSYTHPIPVGEEGQSSALARLARPPLPLSTGVGVAQGTSRNARLDSWCR
eukprot:scaffold67716_cov26-Tisochrysis_lutea.AAC.3